MRRVNNFETRLNKLRIIHALQLYVKMVYDKTAARKWTLQNALDRI